MINILKIARSGMRYCSDKSYRVIINTAFGLYNNLPDEEFLKKYYRAVFHRELNLNDPKTFNEKLQWLKLYNRKPEYTVMVDKYNVRKYVADTIGEQYLIPLLGVWDDPEDIDFDALPEQFVLKCNHNSGLGMCICKDKSKLDIPKVKRDLKKGLEQDYFLTRREWPYKDVPRRIIAEKYMSDGFTEELNDYKLMCFNSKVKSTFVCSNRFSKDGLNVTFYDTDWNRMPFERFTHPAIKTEIAKPKSYDEMVALAERLAQDIPFVHVDFYEINGRLYFGELTFFQASGFEKFNPESWDKTLGDLIKLPGGGYLICNAGYILWLHSSEMETSDSLKDYKFYCFNGVMQFVMINSDRNTAKPTKADYFDRDFNWLDFIWGYPHADTRPSKPNKYDEMIAVAEKLSNGLPHVRVDLYECNNQIYFGELTFFDGSGFDKIQPIEWDYKIGSMIQLPEKHSI